MRTLVATLVLTVCILSGAPTWATVELETTDDEVILTSPDYYARFVSADPKTKTSYGWTLAQLEFKGEPLLTETGAHGAALQPGTEGGTPSPFVGSRHGGETIELIEVIVDGVRQPFKAGLKLRGADAGLFKKSKIGPYGQESLVVLNDRGLEEMVSFTAIDNDDLVEAFYPLMHCLWKGYTHWVAASADEQIDAEGEFLKDDSFTNLGALKWLAVYSEENARGAVISFREPYGSRKMLTNRLWNRMNDHKLYLWPSRLGAAGGTGSFACRVTGFEAGEGDWKKKAATLAANPL